MRVYPLGEMPAALKLAALNQVAVGQQHRVLGFVGTQRHAEHRHHIGAIQKVSDAPEPLGFALREKRIVAHIQAHQLGVFRWVGGGENLQLKFIGQITEHQLVAVHLERRALAIDLHPHQVQLVTVQL